MHHVDIPEGSETEDHNLQTAISNSSMMKTTVSTIYDPKDDAGNCCPSSISTTSSPRNLDYSTMNNRKTVLEHIKKLSFKLGARQGKTSWTRQHLKLFYCFFCLLLILLTLTALMVYLMQSPVRSTVREIIVDGEFQILNQPYQYQLSDQSSSTFKEFTSSIIDELDKLFLRSDVGEYYNKSEILEINPEMTVKCLVLFRNNDNLNVGKIGLAFLRSLRLQHGHTWLGNFTINIQSIGFQIRGEEGEWGEWSQWKGCENETDSVATRTRKCYTKYTYQVTNIDRCLLIPGNKGDLDIMPCRLFRTLSTHPSSTAAFKSSQNISTENPHNTSTTLKFTRKKSTR